MTIAVALFKSKPHSLSTVNLNVCFNHAKQKNLSYIRFIQTDGKLEDNKSTGLLE